LKRNYKTQKQSNKPKDLKSYITHLGTAVPKYEYRQATLAKWMAERFDASDESLARKLKILYQKTSIEKRYSVLSDFAPSKQEQAVLFKAGQKGEPSVEARMQVYRKEIVPLCEKAIHSALGHDFDSKQLTHLITVSCTGMYAPGLELELKESLGLKDDIQLHAVNFVGCYAFFPALKMAKAFCAEQTTNKVLIVSAELCTLHFQNKVEEDHLLSNSLFADGAAACLVQNEPISGIDGKACLELKGQTQLSIPKGSNDMAWNIHSDGFLMRLSSYVPELVNSGIKRLISQLFDKEVEAIDQWAIHPGGRKILEVCAKELNLEENDLSASYEVLKNYGNLSAPTILFVLKALAKQASDGKKVLACGFGPGLTLEGALLKWKVNA
jgi:predicted naringenin-chalcone synthase